MKQSNLDAWICQTENLQHLTRSDLETLQLSRLNKILRSQKEQERFYKDLPEHLDSLKDLKTLPFTTPQMLSDQPGKFLQTSQSEISKIISGATSGTTGPAKRVFYTEKVFVNSCDGCEYEQLDLLYYGDDLVEKYWNDDFYDFVYHDGWYYYTKVLNSNDYVDILDGTHHEKQEILIDFNDSYYDIDFYYEVVQVKNNASEEVWGYSADIDGNNVNWNF